MEFARDLEREGRDRLIAALEASRIRLRPILMTSFAFILGVLPLVVSLLASGCDAPRHAAELAQAIGESISGSYDEHPPSSEQARKKPR